MKNYKQNTTSIYVSTAFTIAYTHVNDIGA